MPDHGIVAGNPVNDASSKGVRTRSRFLEPYHFYDCHRFGEYHPFFIMDGVESDKTSVRSSSNVRSYTLNAPLLQNISMKKDLFMIPLQSLLPLNWEKWYKNPSLGDDVVDDPLVGLGVPNFWNIVCENFSEWMSVCANNFVDDELTDRQKFTMLFRFLVCNEYFFSDGSLLKSLGSSGSNYFTIRPNVENETAMNYYAGVLDFDHWFDWVCGIVSTAVTSFRVRNGENGWNGFDYLLVICDGTDPRIYEAPNVAVCDFRAFLDVFRDEPTLDISQVSFKGSGSDILLYQALNLGFTSDSDSYFYIAYVPANVPQRLTSLWAYQILCAHYYTNDKVDYIYSADLFRQYIQSLCINDLSVSLSGDIGIGDYTFSYNGVTTQYDWLSSFFFVQWFFYVGFSVLQPWMYDWDSPDYFNFLSYLSALMSYKHSLRYLDYFTGARTRPLAVGDVNVDVNSESGVNVVDVTRNIMKQKFLNAVNRAPSRIGGYLKELFGVVVPHDLHDPIYLGHTSDVIFGDETQNTAEAQVTMQVSITSNLRSAGGNYQFSWDVDLPCVIIGVAYYDIPRVYMDATERQNFILNRFDMFNPYMQFIGDQKVYRAELTAISGNLEDSVFAYANRHIEYKERFNQAASGFANGSLPGWIFPADNKFNHRPYRLRPSFIRSYNSELDDFYVSLTGFSLGTYWHFIVDTFNDIDTSRPMAYAPSIL